MRAVRPSTLRFLVDETVAELILKPKLAAFLIAHRSLSIELHQHAWTAGGTAAGSDLALQYTPASSTPDGAAMLDAQRLLTCAAPRYLREHGLPHHPRELRRNHYDRIVVSNGSKDLPTWQFANGTERLDVEGASRTMAPSLSTALALTLGGVGISQIPECWAIGHVRSGRLVRLLPDWEPSLYLFSFEPHGRCNPYASALLRFSRGLIEMGAPAHLC